MYRVGGEIDCCLMYRSMSVINSQEKEEKYLSEPTDQQLYDFSIYFSKPIP